MENGRTNRPGQPFSPSDAEVMRVSHSTGFDSAPLGSYSYVPEARAALRRRRRRTERVMRAPRIVTNKARRTDSVCQSRDVTRPLWRRGLTRKYIYCVIKCSVASVYEVIWSERNRTGRTGEGDGRQLARPCRVQARSTRQWRKTRRRRAWGRWLGGSGHQVDRRGVARGATVISVAGRLRVPVGPVIL